MSTAHYLTIIVEHEIIFESVCVDRYERMSESEYPDRRTGRTGSSTENSRLSIFIYRPRTIDVVSITRGLLTALLELAEDRDPNPVTVSLTVTSAAELEAGLPAGQSVFTDMYLPDTGSSVTAVFGMDLSTPRAAGRFVSHPDGALTLTKSDDLHEVVFVAAPPYDGESVAAFNRSGTGLPLDIVDVEPPIEELGGVPE